MDTQFFYGPRSNSEADALVPPAGAATAGVTGGFLFYSSTAVAYAAGGTSSVPVLYNPTTGPQFNCRIQWVKIGVRAGTWVQGDVGYGITTNASLSSLTPGPAALNCYLGGTQLSNPFLWYTTATSAVAPAVYIPNGLNFGGAAAAGPAFQLFDPIYGSIILAPGTAFYPNISVNAVAATVVVQIFVIATPVGK